MLDEVDRLWKRGAEHSLELLRERVEIERYEMRLTLPCGGEQLLDERRAAAHRVAHDLDRLGHLLGMRFPFLQPGGVAEDNGEDVIEIMRDAAGERAEALHLLRLDKLLLEPFALRVVEEVTFQLGQVPALV